MRFATIAALAGLVLAPAVLAQTPAPSGPPAAATPAAPAAGGRGARPFRFALSPRSEPRAAWVAPHRPHTRLSDVLASHAGQASWSQTLVQDAHWTARFIQMAPGEKTKKLFYPDTEMFWVVQSGQMRVSIDGLEPFIAEKSVIVQVPARTAFTMEVLGNTPSLRFEVTHAGELPVYAAEETPTPIPGYEFVRVGFTGPATPPPLNPEQITLHFDRDVVGGKRPAGRFLKAGSLIRGAAIPTPPADDEGHWHVETSEFYFIMEGQLDYLVEGQQIFTAVQGDVVYVPRGRFHRNNFSGTGTATRLAIFPTGDMNNLNPDNPSRQAP
jgi:mannose-6-phosphate isomerase-like protein (cupin superfamily)